MKLLVMVIGVVLLHRVSLHRGNTPSMFASHNVALGKDQSMDVFMLDCFLSSVLCCLTIADLQLLVEMFHCLFAMTQVQKIMRKGSLYTSPKNIIYQAGET